MKNNNILKLYLITATAAVMLFALSFFIMLDIYTSMAQLYAVTLPFLFVALAALAAFGSGFLTTKCTRAKVTVSCRANNIIEFKSPKKTYVQQYSDYYRLRKIS